jgi:hypothetical protein
MSQRFKERLAGILVLGVVCGLAAAARSLGETWGWW